MIYLSQILKSIVFDSADREIGQLEDLVLKTNDLEYPAVCFYVIKTPKKQKLFLPYKYTDNLGKTEINLNITLNRVKNTEPEGDYLYLIRDILDKQVIDINGLRVVRVNDIKLAMVEDRLCVIGLDISAKGILRRLGMTWLDYFKWLKVNLIDWRDAQQVHGDLQIKTVSEKLKKLHPADLANIVEELNLRQGSHLIGSLEAESSAKIMEEIDPRLQKTLVRLLNKEQVADILEQMSPDELSDLIQSLPQHEAREIIANLHSEKHEKIKALLIYAEDTAGGLMTNEFVTVQPHWTVEKAIQKIKQVSFKFRSILFVYVVDEENKFLGPISMRTLMVAKKNTKLAKLLKKPIADLPILKPEQTTEEIINFMTKYDLFMATVLDTDGKILGVVTLDDVMRCIAPKA